LLTAGSGGYLGIAFAASQTNFIDKFDKANTQGTIGLDLSTSNIDLSSGPTGTAFHANARLGSSTTATLSGTFTPQGDTYRVGGGGGTLTISSALVDAAGPVTRNLDMGSSGTLAAGTVVLTGPILHRQHHHQRRHLEHQQ